MTMDFGPFLEELAALLEVEPSQLQGEYRLDLNPKWDSLTVISVMALVDDHFTVELPGSRLRDCTTIGQILDLIEDSEMS